MTTRRDFIKTSGFLVVGVSLAGVDLSLAAQGLGAGPYPDVDFRQLDSWIVIRQDNTATFFVGKTDLGQGTGTAFRQVMADELDMPYDRRAASWAPPTSPSIRAAPADPMRSRPTAIRCVAWPPRRGACCSRWRRRSFGVPVAQLVVSDGVVSVAADPAKRVTYGELIGGRKFNVTLTGSNVNATTGAAKLKDVQQFKIVGTSPQRYDIPAKVDGSLQVGSGCEGARHGARAQREAAGRGREAGEHRRVVGQGACPDFSRW